ncbi:hypothetical protein B566_EDAN010494 [Ephemera danica]|nr:hypothetical protein B566_EDAN010494 [Ephemera danica]
MEKMDTGKQNQTVVKSVSLANVKRRLEVEKKRIANLRKGRLETKTTPPKKGVWKQKSQRKKSPRKRKHRRKKLKLKQK